jgi:hypothetical protein
VAEAVERAGAAESRKAAAVALATLAREEATPAVVVADLDKVGAVMASAAAAAAAVTAEGAPVATPGKAATVAANRVGEVGARTAVAQGVAQAGGRAGGPTAVELAEGTAGEATAEGAKVGRWVARKAGWD